MIDVMQYQKERLERIGSARDPHLFQVMRKHAPGDATRNRTVIVNWADETTNFGCRFHCTFCTWRERALAAGDICPSPDALESFLEDFRGVLVTISGGGDPLYHPGRNHDRLMALVEQIHRLGFLVEVVTKEINHVIADASGRYKEIDMWSFSSERAQQAVHRAIRAVGGAARVSRVVSEHRRSASSLKDYANFYLSSRAYSVVLREDFLDPPRSQDALLEVAECVHRGQGRVRWLTSAVCSDNLFLVGEQVQVGDKPAAEIAPAAKV